MVLRSFVVRIYRKGSGRGMAGEVESFTPAFRRPFGDKDELWRILAGEDEISSGKRKGGDTRENQDK